MLRRALLFSLVLAGLLGGTDALAAQSTTSVSGEVQELAFAGDTLIVARQPTPRSLSLERLTPGAPAQVILRGPRPGADLQVSLAASAQAVAVGVQTDNSDDGPSSSHVYVGPSTGPLRDVAACPAGLLVSPVAVSGARIAWREGGCGEPTSDPRALGPTAIVVGGPDPSSALRRVVVGSDDLPGSLVLNGEGGLAGVLRPSFFSLNSEVRPIGAGALGEPIATERGLVVAPVGILSNGDDVLSTGSADNGDESDSACQSALSVLTPGSGARRPLSLGGCPVESEFAIPAARVVGDRVYSLVTLRKKKHSRGPSPMALASVRGDGGDARVIARGTYRAPQAIATSESGRVAWAQRSCTGGSEIVIDDAAASAGVTSIPSCTVKVLTRSARVRGSHITIKLRCRSGCSADVVGGKRPTRYLRSFAFKRGTHSLRLRLTRKERKRSRLRLSFEVNDGPSRSAVIRLR